MEKELPLNLKVELFRWGPIPGRFLYTSPFVEVNFEPFSQKYNERWPKTLFLFSVSKRGDWRMLWLNEYQDLRLVGQRVFKKFVLPEKPRQTIRKEWQEDVERLMGVAKKINRKMLSRLTNKELLHLWQKFYRTCINFWVEGAVPELANYGADKLLEDQLSKYIKNRSELPVALETLAAPTKLSFYQKEEIELAETNNIKEHQKKYFWLKNSYAGSRVLPLCFFAERKKKLDKNIKKEILRKLEKAKKKKEEISCQYNLPEELINIAEAISDGVAWQDERKKYIFVAVHYEDLILKEIAKRFNYNFDDLLNCWFWEIAEILKGRGLRSELEKRRGGFGVWVEKDCRNLSPQEVKYFWNIYAEEKAKGEMREFRGIVASVGLNKLTRGEVRILLDPLNVKSFKNSEILVAPMTSPEYIFAMKKAQAVITDAGGLTSHAAIVSRELGIPCIVNTKVATKVLKDGDLVEVDAENGIVRILEKIQQSEIKKFDKST